jgi:2-aminoadipate transaminase
MTPHIALSEASRRTGAPPISELMSRALADPALISLAAGFVDPVTLPVEATAGAVAALLADPNRGRKALQYGSTPGDHHLRAQLLQRLEREEGVPEETFADYLPRLVVTSGSQQLLYLVAEALLDPGDIVLVEAPTYFVFLGVIQSRGARAIGVPIDEGGLRLDALEATLADLEARGQLERVKLIYTVSEHSNPTGLSLAADRRADLVALAQDYSKRHRIYILEDAAYRGLNFSGAEPPSVWRLDAEGETVILARTFSKTFCPGLRIGFGILPEPLVHPVLNLKGNHDFGSYNFGQQVVENLLSEGAYDRQVDRLVSAYRRKRDVLLTALAEHLGPLEGSVSWTHPRGGLYVWLTLPEGLDSGKDGPLFHRCLAEGVLYVPGAYAFAAEPGPPPTNHARLCYGVPGEAELMEGARRLAAALSDCLDPVA